MYQELYDHEIVISSLVVIQVVKICVEGNGWWEGKGGAKVAMASSPHPLHKYIHVHPLVALNKAMKLHTGFSTPLPYVS